MIHVHETYPRKTYAPVVCGTSAVEGGREPSPVCERKVISKLVPKGTRPLRV